MYLLFCFIVFSLHDLFIYCIDRTVMSRTSKCSSALRGISVATTVLSPSSIATQHTSWRTACRRSLALSRKTMHFLDISIILWRTFRSLSVTTTVTIHTGFCHLLLFLVFVFFCLYNKAYVFVLLWLCDTAQATVLVMAINVVAAWGVCLSMQILL